MLGLTGSVFPGLSTQPFVLTYGRLPMRYVRKCLTLLLLPPLALSLMTTATLCLALRFVATAGTKRA